MKTKTTFSKLFVSAVASTVVVSVLVLAAPSAFAQGKPAAKPAAGAAAAPAASGNKVKNYDFSGDDIEGEIVKPDGEDLNARKFAEHASLIRVRTDFIREIVKAAEDI